MEGLMKGLRRFNLMKGLMEGFDFFDGGLMAGLLGVCLRV